MRHLTWFDLLTPDPAAVREALGRVADWSFTDRPGAVPPVTLDVGGAAIAGIEAMRGGATTSHWVGTLVVDDVAAACRSVAFLGGDVLSEPVADPGFGALAFVEDPTGAPLMLVQRSDAPLRSATCLARRDVALRVARMLHGWTETARVDTPAGPLVVLGTTAVLEVSDVAPQWVPHLPVADLEAALEALGGEAILPVTAVPGLGRLALARVADGLPVGLLQAA